MVKGRTNPLLGMPLPLGSLLHAAAQTLTAELDRRLKTAGFDLSSHQAALFLFLDPEGTRSSVIAQRAHISKQAAGEQIKYLVEKGYFTTRKDATDGRASLIGLTERGWSALALGASVVKDFDDWLAGTVGEAAVSDLRDTLTLIIESRK